MKRFAIVSVSDKQGLVPFVKGLVGLNFEILSTGGTAKFLQDQGFAITPIEQFTGQPEILDGRVKSLHPKIHGGILARRDLPQDMQELERHGIKPIDLVAVNLYPFIDKVREIESRGRADHESLVEYIDIGGPTMIRAAAKNSRFVVPVCDPADYPQILAELGTPAGVSVASRQALADKVFSVMSAYDGSIARYFSLQEKLLDAQGRRIELAPVESVVLRERSALRYGENPHQSAGFYVQTSADASVAWEQVQGKELSYNNLLDMYATLDLFLELTVSNPGFDPGSAHTAVIIKHSNPCGAASRPTPREAFTAARDCDPISAFGGIVAISGCLDRETAEAVSEGFVEIVLVREATEEGRAVLAKKKNLRLLLCNFEHYAAARAAGGISYRNYFGEWLVQTFDVELSEPSAEPIAGGKPSAGMLADARFAWRICKHVKSNAIVVVRDLQLIGVGAGQMSRVDSARLALQRAGFHQHSVSGAVAASDAFLPFSDTLEILAAGGVVGLVQPGGSIKDQEVVDAAKRLNVLMYMTGERHFRH